MQHSLIVGGASVVAAALGVSVGVGGVEVATSLTQPPEPFSMTLNSLEYKDGLFHQSFNIRGGRKETIANWSAEIKRGPRQLCSAGGTAPYSDKSEGVSSFTPKQWAGSDCPDKLLPGDVAIAVWQYQGVKGLGHSITGRITIKEQSNDS